MPSLNYNLSPDLRRQLETLHLLRQQVLAIPVSPEHEYQLRFEAIQARLRAWETLSGHATRPRDAARLRLAINHIYFNWTANPLNISIASLDEIADILRGNLPTTEGNLLPVISFLEQGLNSAVIQAAVIHLHMAPDILCHLSSLAYLSRQGYDIHGMAAVENYWLNNINEYKEMLTRCSRLGNITLWIEYYCQALTSTLEHLKSALNNDNRTGIVPAAWKLTERQQAILALLDAPSSIISNKKIQTTFKVSQITASRDLARLHHLGIIAPRGKGRSIVYSHI